MNKKLIGLAIAIVIIFAVVIAITLPDNNEPQKVGSIETGQEYTATTTRMSGSWIDATIKRGYGSLGSVVITKAGDAAFLLLDASTTANKIDNFSTSTKTLASFPASAAAGTYMFDVNFNDGLTLEVVSGDNGTTTITYR